MKKYIITSNRRGNPVGIYGPGGPGYENQFTVQMAELRIENTDSMHFEDLPTDDPTREEITEKFEHLVRPHSRVFTRRAKAREVCAALNRTEQFQVYQWRVIEVGEDVQRDMRPVLGWRVMFREADGRTFESFANDMEGEVLLDNGNRLFETRAQARASAKELNDGVTSTRYYVEPVYGAYTWDTGEWVGALKFRTREHAEQARHVLDGPDMDIRLHMVEVPESDLQGMPWTI